MFMSAGKYLYGSNGVTTVSLSMPSISPTGRLTLLDIIKTCGDEPRNFTIDPTGNYLIAGNRSSDSIVVFRNRPSKRDARQTRRSFCSQASNVSYVC